MRVETACTPLHEKNRNVRPTHRRDFMSLGILATSLALTIPDAILATVSTNLPGILTGRSLRDSSRCSLWRGSG